MRLGRLLNHKFLLNCCNVVFLACGTGLVFGGFQLFSDTHRILLSRLLASASERLNELPHPLFFYIALALAGSGVIAIIASILGFWASCLNTYCFLTLYFLTVIILLLIQAAACIAITIWPHCLGLNLDEIKMVKALGNFYGVPGKEQFTIAMDLAQTKFNCCGMNSDSNYETSLWRLQGYGQRDWPVPLTCCVLQNKYERTSYLDPKPINISQCESLLKSDFERTRHKESCIGHLDQWYREQYVLFLGTCLIIAIVEFCVLLSIVLNCTYLARKAKLNELFELHYPTAKQQMRNLRPRPGQPPHFNSMIVENIYEPSIGIAATAINTSGNHGAIMGGLPPPPPPSVISDPARSQYHISRSYLV
ncbi:tetraspanin-11 [Condylostylus longicornis]|uniref:tetraspanin-11 n=1 Tax=Condylostylus longicornis TaxID=2530218 RepID=UPI00244E19F6|nr:tetraspanin-11 [Condylostylus longicornis]